MQIPSHPCLRFIKSIDRSIGIADQRNRLLADPAPVLPLFHRSPPRLVGGQPGLNQSRIQVLRRIIQTPLHIPDRGIPVPNRKLQLSRRIPQLPEKQSAANRSKNPGHPQHDLCQINKSIHKLLKPDRELAAPPPWTAAERGGIIKPSPCRNAAGAPSKNAFRP